MTEQKHDRWDGCRNSDQIAVSRRVAVTTAGAAILGVVSATAFGPEGAGEGRRREISSDMRERMEQSRAFAERMRNVDSPEELEKFMAERRARAVEGFKGQLGVSDQEWAVIKPRIEAVYDIVHPAAHSVRGNTRPMTPVDQKKSDLRKLLDENGTTPEQIKAGLTALRAANEKVRQDLAKARQDLRQLLTVRQEATLVLSGLLD
mgnify:CR=1 FL=1